MRKYEVVLVSPKEYEAVAKSDPRYSNVMDSMGFADPSKNKAYVRSTGVMELNKYLINHEFEHLLEDEATDEDEHGIRHKKFFKQILAPAVAPVIAPFIQRGFNQDALRDVGRVLTSGAAGFATGGPVGGVLGASAQGLRNAAVPPGTENELTGRSLLGAAGTGAASGTIGRIGGNLVGAPAAATQGPNLGSFFPGKGGTTTTGIPGSAARPGPSVATGLGSRSAAAASGAPGSISKFRPDLLTQNAQFGGAGNLASTIGPGTQFSSVPAAAGLGAFGGSLLTQNAQFGGAQNLASQINPMTQFQLAPANPAVDALGIPTLRGVGAGQQGQPPSLVPQQQAQAPGLVGDQSGQQVAQQATQQFNPMDIISQGVKKIQSGLGLSGGQLATIGAGAGLLGFAERGGPPAPEVPNFREIPSIQQLSGIANAEGITRGSASPLGDLARTRLGEQLSGQFGGLSPEVTGGIKRQFDDLRRQVSSQFKLFRPAADLESDSAFRQAMAEISQREAETVANLQLQQQNIFDQTRRQDISTALGVDENTMNTLIQLANLDIAQIMTQLGLDAAEATRFKQTFGQLGGSIAGAGIGSALGAFGQGQQTASAGGP